MSKPKPDEEPNEIVVMGLFQRRLDAMAPDARGRVLQWALAKYAADLPLAVAQITSAGGPGLFPGYGDRRTEEGQGP